MKRLFGIYILFAAASFLSMEVSAQSDISQASNWYNRVNYNPATITRDDYLYLFSNFRKQWLGVKGAPATINLQAAQYFYDAHYALGFTFIGEKIGVSQVVNPMVMYAYRIDVDREKKFSMGLSMGLFARINNGSLYEPENITDPAINYNWKGFFRPDANIGFEYQTNHFIYTFSSTHLFSIAKSNTSYTISNHRYLGAIYKNNEHQMLNYHLGLQLINRQNIVVAEGSAILRVKYQTGLIKGPQELFDIGIIYRSSRQMIALLGINVRPNLKLGYAYSQSFISGYYTTMTNEIMLEYRIPKKAAFARQYRNRGFWYN